MISLAAALIMRRVRHVRESRHRSFDSHLVHGPVRFDIVGPHEIYLEARMVGLGSSTVVAESSIPLLHSVVEVGKNETKG